MTVKTIYRNWKSQNEKRTTNGQKFEKQNKNCSRDSISFENLPHCSPLSKETSRERRKLALRFIFNKCKSTSKNSLPDKFIISQYQKHQQFWHPDWKKTRRKDTIMMHCILFDKVPTKNE